MNVLSRILIVSIMCVCITSPVWAIDLNDYHLPIKHLYQEWDLGGMFDYHNDGGQAQANYDGDLNTTYGLIHSTLPLNWTLILDGQLDFARAGTEEADMETGYTLGVFTSAERYFQDLKQFTSLVKILEKIAFWGRDADYSEASFLVYGETDSSYRKQVGFDDADDPFLELGGGIGFGRIIDSSNLAKAIRFTQDLEKYGVIIAAQNVSDHAILEIADLLERKDEYEARYGSERYMSYWLKDVAEVLRRDGVLQEDAMDTIEMVIRFQEILDDIPISERSHGRLLRLGVSAILSDYDGGDTPPPSWTILYNYAFPSSLKWQFNNDLEYAVTFDDGLDQQLYNVFTASYDVTDRLAWENAWMFRFYSFAEDEFDSTYRNTFYSTLEYYITEKVTLAAELTVMKVKDVDDMQTDFELGVVYHIK